MSPDTIKEHDLLPCRFVAEAMPYGPGLVVNPEARDEFHRKYFFKWERSWNDSRNDDFYRATYVVGAQWVDVGVEKYPLIVVPKICGIDFMRMFDVCFQSDVDPERFSGIYGIDLEAPYIQTSAFQSVLSPLIVVHFLSVVKRLLKRGLRKDYVASTGNLRKIKGRVDFLRNERSNVIPRRYDRVYCRYQEYSANTQENRLIKRALLLSCRILQNRAITNSVVSLQTALGGMLSAFSEVEDTISTLEVKAVRRNKLFKDYDEAIRLAKMILRRYDSSITKAQERETETPSFWIDMSLLYEHYVLSLLRKEYKRQIEYQKFGRTGVPDFVYNAPRIILDAKYIPGIDSEGIGSDIVRQLSGYARDKQIVGDRTNETVPCAIIYPNTGAEENPFSGHSLSQLLVNEEPGLIKFYKIGVPLPMTSCR